MNVYKAVNLNDYSYFYIISKDDKIAKIIFVNVLSKEVENYIDYPIKKGSIYKILNENGWTFIRCSGIFSTSKIQGSKVELTDRTYSYKYDSK